MKIDLSGERPGFQFDDPELLLDTYQREALDFDREIIVSAGAGSGKTSTLSLRYTRLLVECAWKAATSNEEECRIEQVLVLTFTDKAAQEMAERCERQLRRFVEAAHKQQEDILQRWGAAAGRRFLTHLDSLIGQFNRARVSTFHSFYTAILREHALRIGLSPGFRVADDLERRELLQKVARTAFEAWRPTVSDANYRELAHDLGGRRGIEEALVKLLGERSKFFGLTEGWEEPGALLESLQEEAPLTPEEVEHWIKEEALPAVRSLAECLAPGEKDLAGTVASLANRLADPPSDPFEKHQLTRDVYDVLCSGDKPRSFSDGRYIGSQKHWKANGIGHLLEASKETAQQIYETVSGWLSLRPTFESLPVARDRRADRGSASIWSLYNAALKELDRVFSSQQLEDFDGMELRVAKQLAEDPELTDTLVQSIRYVMVDEFQDTNALQWEILQHLARPNGQKSDRLFAVGDLKQAIYSFRGGDVTVFTEAMQSIDSQVQLKYNYRSTPEIVAFNNALFANLMGFQRGDRPSWEAHYTEVAAGRSWETSGEIGAWSYDSVSAKENAEIEATWIADKCRSLLDPHGAYKEHHFGSTAHHPESPIAILLRKRTHLPTYQAALARAGVSCRVVKGVGFWRRRDVLDLLLALQAVVRGDAVSVVGFLRSPLACVSDPTLHALSQGVFGATHKNFTQAPLSANAPPELLLAQSTLRSLSEMAPHRSLRSLAEEIIRRCAGPHAWLEDSSFEEAEANVLKLLQLCTEYGNQGWSHGRILHLFEQEAQNLVKEKEADATGTQARVLIQTVHSAKGLQFPVVFLPALGGETSHNDTLVVGRANGKWAAAYKVFDPKSPHQTKKAPVRHTQITDQKRAEERAESLRKLYVATTRAESHLYFVGPFNKPGANSWASWVESSLDTDWGPVKLEENQPQSSGADEAAGGLGKPDPVHSLIDCPTLSWKPTTRVTPSSIRLYKACPIKWKLAQTYGTQPSMSSHQDHAREAAARRGDLLHDLIDNRRFDPAYGVMQWRSASRLEPWPASVIQQQEQRLRADLETLRESETLQNMLTEEAHSEPGFEVAHGCIRLYGRIDLLWRDGGSWVLTDFKSEDLGRSSNMNREHRDQLTAYAWAAGKLLGEPVRSIELFGTRDGKRYPLSPLTSAEFESFEKLLNAIEEDSELGPSELETRVLKQPDARPCDTCSYRNSLCKGQSPS